MQGGGQSGYTCNHCTEEGIWAGATQHKSLKKSSSIVSGHSELDKIYF